MTTTTTPRAPRPSLSIAECAMSIRVMRAGLPRDPDTEYLDIAARRNMVQHLRSFRLLRAELGLPPVIRLPH